jgi:hypothetical protein
MMNLRKLLTAAGLMLLGLAAALVALTVVMMVAPRPFLGSTSYYDRLTRGVSQPIEYRNIDGDLFVALPGRVRPPETIETLAAFTITWDADGFREPAFPAVAYPVAVFGDSFTESVNTPIPYPDGLSAQLGVGVRNYGYRAYGPREIAQAAAEVAGREPRRWLIYGYFSGNDLGDAVRPPKIDTRSPLAVWDALIARLSGRLVTAPPLTVNVTGQYDFPMPVIIGDKYYELAFLPYYLWWQIAPDEGFEASANWQVVSDTLDALTESVDADACRLLMFIPTKEQLYYPYIYPSERRWLRGVGSVMVIEAGGRLAMRDAPYDELTESERMLHFTDQRDALARLAVEKGWQFLDLSVAFGEAVAQGELLYYPFDTHWNQAGHDLAAEVIAGYLRAHPECGI